MKPDEFQALISGGVPTYQVTQGLFMMIQEIKAVVKALKFNNRKLFDLETKIDALEPKGSS